VSVAVGSCVVAIEPKSTVGRPAASYRYARSPVVVVPVRYVIAAILEAGS
jgi:hypothetical protein